MFSLLTFIVFAILPSTPYNSIFKYSIISDGLLACQECTHYQRWSHESVLSLLKSGEPKISLNAQNILPKISSSSCTGLPASLLWTRETSIELVESVPVFPEAQSKDGPLPTLLLWHLFQLRKQSLKLTAPFSKLKLKSNCVFLVELH